MLVSSFLIVGTSSCLKIPEWTVYNQSNSKLPCDKINSLAIKDQGYIWIGTHGGGLAKFDGVGWIVYNMRNSDLPSNDIWAFAIDNQENKWIGTSKGLVFFDGQQWEVNNTTNSGIPANEITAIAFDIDWNAWIATYGDGLAIFRKVIRQYL